VMPSGAWLRYGLPACVVCTCAVSLLLQANQRKSSREAEGGALQKQPAGPSCRQVAHPRYSCGAARANLGASSKEACGQHKLM
jgi:hypothetical protein